MTMVESFYAVTASLLGIGVSVSWIEHFANRRHLRPGGPLSYETMLVGRSSPRWPALERSLRAILGYPGFLIVLGLQALAVVAMLVLVWGGRFHPGVQGLLLCTLLVSNYRSWYALEGSDQVIALVAAALFAFSLRPDSEWVAQAGLWFIALQSCLAYVSSGVTKFFAPRWRNGDALRGVINTETYGRPKLARLLHDKPGLAQALSWNVIVVQGLFPVALLLGPAGLLFLAWGFAFHATSVFVMGIHRFFWAFIATYPAIWFCIRQVEELWPKL